MTGTRIPSRRFARVIAAAAVICAASATAAPAAAGAATRTRSIHAVSHSTYVRAT